MVGASGGLVIAGSWNEKPDASRIPLDSGTQELRRSRMCGRRHSPQVGQNRALPKALAYLFRMWPGAYWRMWTDGLIHSIHHRVLAHIKQLCEADVHRLPGQEQR